MPFSEKAKALYLKGNLSQKDIAKLADVSESAVSRYFNGKTVPDAEVAEKILKVLAAAIPEEAPKEEHKPESMPKKEQPQDIKLVLDHVSRIYDGHIAQLQAALKLERKEKWIFVCALGLVIALVFLIFFIDLTNGHVGWWRY